MTSTVRSDLGIAPTEDTLEGLPSTRPCLVLLGSDDPSTARVLDRLSTVSADVLDLRSDVLWTEVSDGRAFLDSVIDNVAERRDSVRIAFAPVDASVDDLQRRALLAPTLNEMARRIEAAELQLNPPVFAIRYQPIRSLSTDDVIGFESLIRATAGARELDAEELIRRAGDGGWIPELDELGRSLALKGIGPWLGEGLLFLNMMAPDGRFDLEAVRATVQAATDAGLAPDQIVLEATERNRYTDLDIATEQINEIRELGVRIAVDDVGDGFSSLRVVAAFAPDVVKIAGPIIADLPSDAARAVIGAVVSMAHNADAWVVAENVETVEQADQLRTLGVDWGQGHFLGAPAAR